MEDLICYFDGKYIEQSKVRLSLWDAALWEGMVYEMARTYNHVPFFWKEHIDRMYRSLRYVRIDPGLTQEQMYNVTLEVLERNGKYLEPGDDFVVAHGISRGAKTNPYLPSPPPHPTVMVNLFKASPAYKMEAKMYQEGIHLVVVNTRQVPNQCLDPKAKITNRMCNALAEMEAKVVSPEAWALMLDFNGRVAEGPKYSCFMVKDGKLYTPKSDNILAGVTRGVILKLARELRIEAEEKNLWVFDLYNADEIFITAQSFTIGPVAKFNDRLLQKPIPGPVTQRLLSAFSKLVGVDIVQRVIDYLKSHNNQ